MRKQTYKFRDWGTMTFDNGALIFPKNKTISESLHYLNEYFYNVKEEMSALSIEYVLLKGLDLKYIEGSKEIIVSNNREEYYYE